MAIVITTHYNIEEGGFPNIVKAIKAHLTPKKEPTRRTEIFLEKLNEQLIENPAPYSNFMIKAGLDPRLGASLARDLGMFREIKDFDEEEEFCSERYFVPSPGGFGMTNSFTLDLFGTAITGAGPYPATIRLIGDFGDMSDQSYLLGIAKEIAAEKGINGLADWKSKSRKTARELDSSSTHGLEETILGIDLTEEDIQKQITELNVKRSALSILQSVNALRFYWDFFGAPIDKLGHKYTGLNANGFNVTDPYLREIVAYPTKKADEFVKDFYRKELVRV